MDSTTSRRGFLAVGGTGLAALAIGAVAPRAAADINSRSRMREPAVSGGGTAAPGGTITDLGEPVAKTQALGTGIGKDADGKPVALLVTAGSPTVPCEFAVVDLRSQKTTLDIRVPEGNATGRTLSISPTTGDAFFATTNQLYRYQPGATDVELLTESLVDGETVWTLKCGPDGTVWVGTYPGGLLVSYDPTTGAVTNHGQALSGQQYIGAIQAADGIVYCGTQAGGRLASYDLAAGTFTEIALPNGPIAPEIDAINLAGTTLFVTTGGTTFVRDTTTDTWVDTIASTSGYGVSPVDATGTLVYVRAANKIQSYNLQTKALTSLNWAPNAAPENWSWIDLDGDGTAESIAFPYWNYGRIYAYNTSTKATYYLQPTLMGAGDQLTAIGAGPDGNIYCGAYLSPPGMGRWDPDKTGFELLTGTSQVEGFGSFNGDLVFGRYPQGRLYRYDLDQPWSGTNPGPQVDLDVAPWDQNRPQSFVQLDDTTVAVATVPQTGELNGAITIWTPSTNAVDVHRGVIENQTPVCLVKNGNVLIGGTSINGGYGVDPVTTDAVLFGWDPATFKVNWQLVPVSDATTVAGLIIDEKQQLWGIADNVLFQFDPKQRKVVHRTKLFSSTDGSRYGNDHVLRIVSGHLYGVTSNRVFEFDRQGRQTKVIYDGPASAGGGAGDARHLAVDRYGDLYFIGLASHLMRYHRS